MYTDAKCTLDFAEYCGAPRGSTSNPSLLREAFVSSPPLNSFGNSSLPVASFAAIETTYFGEYLFELNAISNFVDAR